jgi:hypothetical protein
MTIAVVVRVNDGFVLASDSATTLGLMAADGSMQVANIYNNANKIFNLHKGLPIAAMTWGLGSIGPASITTLAKDLRRRFEGRDQDHLDWKLDEGSYSMTEVAAQFKTFFYDERYEPLTKSIPAEVQVPYLGLLVAGYSSRTDEPEAFTLALEGKTCTGPNQLVAINPAGASWWGMPDAITRLLLGVSSALPQALENLGVPTADVAAYALAIQQQVQQQLVTDAMPIQDAIDLAEFLVDTTIKFVRFSPGNPMVGGPVEIAAVTKHEGFKWVMRKHYYDTKLNPPLELI